MRAPIISWQKAGRSAGTREVITLPSRTNSRPRYSAPAFTRPSLMPKKQVAYLSITHPAEARSQPAWQMARTILPDSSARRKKSTIASVLRVQSRANPPGATTAS